MLDTHVSNGVTNAVTKEDMRDEFLKCRTLLHAWEERPNNDLDPPEVRGDWWLNLVCLRCETRRIDLIDANGEAVSRRYKYPDGYELDEKVTRSEMRNEWAQRAHLGTFSSNKQQRSSNGKASR